MVSFGLNLIPLCSFVAVVEDKEKLYTWVFIEVLVKEGRGKYYLISSIFKETTIGDEQL